MYLLEIRKKLVYLQPNKIITQKRIGVPADIVGILFVIYIKNLKG
jgi:hypothetical protein